MTNSSRLREAGAFLFDLDGTIVDSDPLHRLAFAEVLEPAGYHVTEAFFHHHIHGKKVADIFATLMPDHDAAALDARKERIFRERLAMSDLKAARGLEAFLLAAKRLGIPCAVATNGSLENAKAVVKKLNIEGYFSALVAAEQVAFGKPAPDVYLTAAKLAGADPKLSVAFEDSVPGVLAARAAGCRVFGMTTSLTVREIVDSGADCAVPDFSSPEVVDLLR